MQELVWDETLSVQVEEIDEDHRKLIGLFNLLERAVAGDEPREYVEALLEELIAATEWHFRHEERLMIRHGYPDRQAHWQEHRELVKGLRALHEDRLREGRPLSARDVEHLERWLTGHILGADMELGAWLAGRL